MARKIPGEYVESLGTALDHNSPYDIFRGTFKIAVGVRLDGFCMVFCQNIGGWRIDVAFALLGEQTIRATY